MLLRSEGLSYYKSGLTTRREMVGSRITNLKRMCMINKVYERLRARQVIQLYLKRRKMAD